MKYNALSKKQEKELNEIINNAINCVKKRNELRFKIVEYALEARKYGMETKDFAKKIDMKYTTLAEWISLKTCIYDKLPNKKNYKTQKSILFYKEIRKFLPKNASSKLVQETYDRFINNPDFLKFQKYIVNLETILSSAEKRNLNGMSEEQASQIDYLCGQIRNSIKKQQKKVG